VFAGGARGPVVFAHARFRDGLGGALD